MSRIGLWMLGVSILGLHVYGYADPAIVIESTLVNRVILPVLLVFLILFRHRIRATQSGWREDGAIRFSAILFATLGLFEIIMYALLTFGLLSTHMNLNSAAELQFQRSRFGRLAALSVLGMAFWPVILSDLRRKSHRRV